jgi:thymidylate synthase (FAD)
MSATKADNSIHDTLASRVWCEQKYLAEGLGCPEIGHLVERDPKTVHYWLRKHGIPTRQRGADVRQHFPKGTQTRLGIKHTQEAIEKVRQASLDRGAVPYLRNGVHFNKGKRGAVVANWNGGVTPERQTFYRSDEWKAAVKAVWKRADAKCERCGLDHRTIDRKAAKFHIHHIVSFAVKELRCDVDNLVLLCRPCHLWVHSNANTERQFIKATD